MTTSTFKNLNEKKKNIIFNALLTEFSEHSLANAQVARIITKAQISRGAFYNYFNDLKDAYQYLFSIVIHKVHDFIGIKRDQVFSSNDYFNFVKKFIDLEKEDKYFPFIKMYFTENERLIDVDVNLDIEMDLIRGPTFNWAATVLSHDTIRQYFLMPELKDMLLDKLKNSLEILGSRNVFSD